FAGSTEFYQLVTQKSFFGDLTEEVLQYVIDEKKKRKPALMKKHRPKFKIRRKQKNKFKNEKEKIKKKIKIQKNKKKNIEKQHQNIQNIKSFKLTKPLRKISQKLK